MASPLFRIRHRDSGRHFIVDGLEVYAESGRSGRIRRIDRMSGSIDGVEPGVLVAVATYFTELYDTPYHGAPYAPDPAFTCGGILNAVEATQFSEDPEGVRAVRTALERHLDFFDTDTADGCITIGENWRGWRRLGYGLFRSLLKTIGAAVIFGRVVDRFAIKIARICEKRTKTSTGLYGENGELNEPVLAECMAEFRARAPHGPIGHAEALAIVTAAARPPGRVSRRQFKSLFELCTRLNRDRNVITGPQFEGLFDGYLLHLAASIPDRQGQRRQFPRPEAAPVLVRVAVLAMAALFAWRLGNPFGIWSPLDGWLIVAASWLLYLFLGWRTSVERSVVLVLGVLAAACVWSSLTWSDTLSVWPLILLGAAVAIGQQWRPVLQYTFYCRFPLLLALTIMLLPLVGVWGAPLLFKSMFMLGARSIVFVVLLTALAAEVALATGRVIAQNAHRRFSVTRWDGPANLMSRRGTWIAFVIALPVATALAWLAETSRPIAAFAVAAGFILSFILVRGAKPLGRWLTSSERWWRGAVEPKREKLARALEGSDGYVKDGQVVPGHLANAGLFATTLVIYAIGYFVFKPNGAFEAPAIAFVVFMLIMIGWFLPAVSFFADKYKVSTVLSLAVIPYILFFINDIDHYYFDTPAAQAEGVTTPAVNPAPTGDLRMAFEARMRRASAQYPVGDPVMIAVAAGGGGGSAALWSARVLAGLQQQFGARFTDSIHMVSAVSGGSVGTVHFLSAFTAPANGASAAAPTASRLDAATRNAGRSMLASVAWGLAYPDFWRFLSLPHLNPYVDRGWALEEALDRRLQGRGVRLSHWRDGILAGWRPPVVFNATVSETGDRLVISPLRLSRATLPCRAAAAAEAACEDQVDAATLSASSDLRVATAARLSATFPYVMPIPKPQLPHDDMGYHIADGGYYDNDGLLTLVEWARKALVFAAPYPVRKMLIIDIRVIDPKPTARQRPGWLYATVGPLLTVLNTRGTSQVSRNRLDVSLLSGLHQADGLDIQLVELPLTLMTSRAWHLPASEQDAIEEYWNHDAHVVDARRQICRILSRAGWADLDCAVAATGSL